MIDISQHNYTLPNGYSIMSFDDADFDVEQYYNAKGKGFNNQRQRNEIEMESMRKRESFDVARLVQRRSNTEIC